MALSASYHRRQHRNGLGILDRARGPEAYAPITRTYVDPESGQTQSITIYNLRPEFITARDRVINNVEFLQSDYDGVQFDFQKRMSNRWQMLAGLSLQTPQRLRPQRHLHRRRLQQPELVAQPRRRLGVHRPAVGGDAVGQLPVPLGHDGLGQVHRSRRRPAQPHRHLLGADRVAGERDRPAGAARHRPHRRRHQVRRPALRQALRRSIAPVSKPRSTSSTSSTPTTCCCRTRQIGTTWGRPTRILTPRIIRFGVTARF